MTWIIPPSPPGWGLSSSRARRRHSISATWGAGSCSAVRRRGWKAASLIDPRDQILLYNYVASGGGQAPQGMWVGMESLPNSIAKVRTLAAYC